MISCNYFAVCRGLAVWRRRCKHSKIPPTWLWMSMYPTDSSAPGDLQDMSTPSPVKVRTLNVSQPPQFDRHGIYNYSYRLSLFLQVTLVDPCSYKKESATFRSAILPLKKGLCANSDVRITWTFFSCFISKVGVLSWGTMDVCNPLNTVRGVDRSVRPHPDARDFHIDLFKIMPWLKEHLGEEIQFLPDVNWKPP